MPGEKAKSAKGSGRPKKPGRAGKPSVAEATAAYAVSPAGEATTRKNLRLHQSKIDAARAALGTATETETIEAALDLIVFRNELVAGVRAMRGAELVDLFD